jgi:hypothetical protein
MPLKILRDSSFEEFATWYLERERRKRGGPLPSDPIREMQRAHPAKLRRWFPRGHWRIAQLQEPADALSLVCLDNWETRRAFLVSGTGPDIRLAASLVGQARANYYFDNNTIMRTDSVESHYRQTPIEQFRAYWPILRGPERLTIIALNDDERAENPSGTYYLHDGLGRLLAYLYLVVFEGRDYHPIEVFLAEPGPDPS